MTKLDKRKSIDKVRTLNVSILSVKYNKKATAEIIGAGIANFGSDESGNVDEKPKLLLKFGEQRYDFVLNVTNQEVVGNILESLGKERDTDEIPTGSQIELEVYETGSGGQFEFGIRVNSLTFPK